MSFKSRKTKKTMKTINENYDTIAFMQRPQDNDQGFLKLNVKKDLDKTIDVGDKIFSHKSKSDKVFYYEIMSIIEIRQSTLKNYNYCIYKAKLVQQ